jgi:hypothetical protein
MGDEPVPRVESVEAAHDPISHDLGHDRGGRDRRTSRVSVDDRLVRWSGRTKPEAVDQTGICRGMEIP